MIVFRSVDLETAVPGIMIEDIRVSPIQRSATIRPRPIQPGVDFVRIVEGERTVTITFSILELDRNKRRRLLDDLARWALSSSPEALILPYRENRVLYAICTAIPEPSTRQWWETKLSLTFTAYDPFFYGPEKSVACGTAFFVGGSGIPKMRIERTLTAQASDQSYSDGTNTMIFSTIPAGALVIDLNRQTAAVGGSSIMEYWPLTGAAFIVPRRGTMTITGTGTVKYREAYE